VRGLRAERKLQGWTCGVSRKQDVGTETPSTLSCQHSKSCNPIVGITFHAVVNALSPPRTARAAESALHSELGTA